MSDFERLLKRLEELKASLYEDRSLFAKRRAAGARTPDGQYFFGKEDCVDTIIHDLEALIEEFKPFSGSWAQDVLDQFQELAGEE